MKKLFVYVSILTVIALSSCQKSMDNMMDENGNGKSGSITRFAVHNNYMYALDQNRVLVYQLTSDQPQLVSVVKTDYGLETITVYEGTVYLGSRTALYILDISNPSNPAILSKTERVGTFFGGCDPVVVKGNYAYSTIKIIENVCGQIGSQSAMLIYDVSNKSNPILKNQVWLDMPNGLGYEGNYLFICDEGAAGVLVYDISIPDQPEYINTIPLQNPIDVIATDGKVIISAKTSFAFYDISNINNIKKIGEIGK